MSDRSELGDKCFWNPEWAEQEIERLTAELADCKESDRLIERLQARVGELEGAIAALLEDTQHSEHICPDDDCPVRLAKAALKEESDDG
jgi:hypothetical protein